MQPHKQTSYREVQVGEQIFHIRPFSAFTSVNILGQLNQFFTPLMGGAAPLFDTLMGEKTLDSDISKALPVVMSALGSVSGTKVENMLKTLLIQHENISFTDPSTSDNKVVKLTESQADELFCQNSENMFLLAFEVIKVNYEGFFPKLASQFGLAFTKKKMEEIIVNTGNSMATSSAS